MNNSFKTPKKKRPSLTNNNNNNLSNQLLETPESSLQNFKTPTKNTNANANNTPSKKSRKSLFNTNILSFIDRVKQNKTLTLRYRNIKNLFDEKRQLFTYLKNTNVINITDVNNKIVTNTNMMQNVRGTSSIIFSCKYNNKPAVIKFLDDSQRSENEIEITKFLAKKDISPKVYTDGKINRGNISYLYFITEKYDGDLLHINQNTTLKYFDVDIAMNIKNIYSTFYNLLKSKGLFLLHGDISPTNFVYKKNENTYSFKLIDFDRISITDTKDNYRGDELLKIDKLLYNLHLL